jgi:RHS repeat-associated protein
VVLNDGTNSYLYGPDGLPVEQIANGVATWYHHDQLGSTRSLTNASGAVVATATYDAYGNLTASTGALSPMGFSGEYTDAETGFVYLRARYYDPATGQFISRDPLVALTGAPYAYAGGSPLNQTDPSGLCGRGWWGRNWKWVALGVAVAAVAAYFVAPVVMEAVATWAAERAAAAAIAGTIAAEDGSGLVRYDPEWASRQIAGQNSPGSTGYATTPGGRDLTVHAAERVFQGGPGRAPIDSALVDEILDNGSSVTYRGINDPVTVRAPSICGKC